LQGGRYEEAYYGLLSAYEKKNIPDSIAKYAKLYAKTNDSIWLSKNSQTVEQMTAMYDYSRHKKQAEENAVRAEHAEKTRTRLLLLLIFVAIAAAYIFSKVRKAYKKKMADKEKELQTLEEKYVEAMDAYTEADKDIRLLKLEYAKMMEEMNIEKKQLENDIHQLSSQNSHLKDKIEEKVSALNKLESDIREETSIYSSSLQEKNEAIEELKNEIENLTSRIKSLNPDKLEKEFLESDIYQRFLDVANPNKKTSKITKKEWKLFSNTFVRCYPDSYTFIKVNQSLTSDQIRVYMLLKAGFSEGKITLLMDTNNKRITRIKSQVNNKLFGENNAKTLRSNLEIYKK